MATGMAIRAIDDAICQGGLLKKAILQLQQNFENAGRKARKTWMGRFIHVVRVTWPNFRILTMPTLRLSGVPPREPDVKLSKHFSRSAWGVNWKKRQASLLNNPPARNQQNYLLYIILENLCARKAEDANLLQQRPTLQSPIFPHLPTMWIASFRCLVKFLERYGQFRTGECTSTSLEVLPRSARVGHSQTRVPLLLDAIAGLA